MGNKEEVTSTQAVVSAPVSGDAGVILYSFSSLVLRFQELSGHDAPKAPE